MKLYELAHVLRSKNSGPFAVTLDILFDDPAVYERVKRSGKITPENIARLYGLKVEDITLPAMTPVSALRSPTCARPRRARWGIGTCTARSSTRR